MVGWLPKPLEKPLVPVEPNVLPQKALGKPVEGLAPKAEGAGGVVEVVALVNPVPKAGVLEPNVKPLVLFCCCCCCCCWLFPLLNIFVKLSKGR